MADSDTPAPEENTNPLASPSWLFERDDDVRLAPRPEKFFSDLTKVQAARSDGPEVAMPASAIVADPDTITSPADALDQARKRIAAMRASLQLNLNQVAESFNHPIFTVQTAEAQTAPENSPPIPASETVSPSATTVTTTEIQINETVVTETLQTQVSIDEEPVTELTGNRIFTPTESEQQPETQVEQPVADHSLELMIMRDEIKDLRDRLDASQKLIEELMHRLANLAELALRR